MSEPLLDIVVRSVLISGTAVLLSVAWGVPISLAIALKRFRGRQTLISFFNAMWGIPTVSIGLILYFLFSGKGILYTPSAIVIGQAILVTPIVVSLLINAIEAVDPKIKDLAKTLGASERQASIAVLGEARKGSVLSGIVAFNRAIAELGIAMMVGGPIFGYTNVMSTTIARGVETDPDLAIQLTVVLLIIVFGLTFLVNLLRRD